MAAWNLVELIVNPRQVHQTMSADECSRKAGTLDTCVRRVCSRDRGCHSHQEMGLLDNPLLPGASGGGEAGSSAPMATYTSPTGIIAVKAGCWL